MSEHWTPLKRSLVDTALRHCEPDYDAQRWPRAYYERFIELIVDAGVQFDSDLCDEVCALLNQLAESQAQPLDTSALDAVRAEERERCAKVCDEAVSALEHEGSSPEMRERFAAARGLAAAIRALGGRP